MPDGRAKVVIVGAGFGGIEAAKSLRCAPVECFDGHVWTPIVSSGDVAVMVSRLRQRRSCDRPNG